MEDFTTINEKVKFVKLNFKIQMRDKHMADVGTECRLSYEDLELIENYSTEVRLKYEQCDVCSKIASSYFTAIIQVRADKRPLTENEIESSLDLIIKEIERTQIHDREVFISKLEKMHGGLDAYISKQSAAKQIVKLLLAKYGGTTTISHSLVGQKDGKDVNRITILARFPEYQKRDIVDISGKKMLITNITSRKIDVIDLTTWSKASFSSRNIKNLKILAKFSDYHKAQAVSQSEKDIQILDLESYKTYDMPIPQSFYNYIKKPKSEMSNFEIYLVILDDGTYLVPAV